MLVTDKNYPQEQVCIVHGDVYNCTPSDINDIDDIKNLTGDFCLVLCKEDRVILATDPFRTQLLFVNIDSNNRKFAISNDPREIKKLELHPYLLEENTILVLDLHTYSITKQQNRKWDLTQKDRTHTKVFDAFEQAISNRFNNKTKLLLSSGYDSGATACALYKQGHRNFSVTWLDLCMKEDKKILGERLQLHKGKILKHKKKDISHIQNMFKYPYMNDSLAEAFAATFEYLKSIEMDTMLVGHGGCYYNDYGWKGKQLSPNSQFGGLYPTQLELVYPRRINNIIGFTGGVYLTSTYYQCYCKQAILDSNLVQAWIHTIPELKNKHYRNWMYEYMRDHNYPLKPVLEYFNQVKKALQY